MWEVFLAGWCEKEWPNNAEFNAISNQVSSDYKWTHLTLKYSFLLILLHMYKQSVCFRKTYASFYLESHISQRCPQRRCCHFFSIYRTPFNTFWREKEKKKKAYPAACRRAPYTVFQHAAYLCNNWHEGGIMLNRILIYSMQMFMNVTRCIFACLWVL